jgi:putative transcriptional regulator
MRERIENSVQILRTDAGLTQEQLAEALGVSRQTVIAIEKGNYAPSVSLALRIARVLKRRVEDIFVLRYGK